MKYHDYAATHTHSITYVPQCASQKICTECASWCIALVGLDGLNMNFPWLTWLTKVGFLVRAATTPLQTSRSSLTVRISFTLAHVDVCEVWPTQTPLSMLLVREKLFVCQNSRRSLCLALWPAILIRLLAIITMALQFCQTHRRCSSFAANGCLGHSVASHCRIH